MSTLKDPGEDDLASRSKPLNDPVSESPPGATGTLGGTVSAAQIESIEKDFADVLKDLSAEEHLERFRTEFEKLHRALKKSHESEKRLMKRTQELNAEIVANAGKVQSALKLSQEDQMTIQSLKKEVEKAWKMVDAANDKEARAKETIQHLKKEIGHLSQLVEQGAGLTAGQENSVQELVEEKKALQKELFAAQQKSLAQSAEVKDLTERLKRLEIESVQRESECQVAMEARDRFKREYEVEARKRETLTREVKDMNNALTQRAQDLKHKSVLLQQSSEKASQAERELKEERERLRELALQKDKISKELLQRQLGLEELFTQNQTAHKEIQQLSHTLTSKDHDLHRYHQEQVKSAKLHQQLLQQIKKAQQERDDQIKAKEALRCEMVSLERNLDVYHKELDASQKELKEVTRDRDVLQKKFLESQSKQNELVGDVKVAKLKSVNLEVEIHGHCRAHQKQKKAVYELEKERETYARQASDALTRYYQSTEELKITRMKIVDYQKQIAESEQKLHSQQSLYEAVRSDRNLYSKQLIEATDEINEMKRKQQMMTHQIEQLKEELTQKEKRLAEAFWDRKNLDRKVEEERQQVQDYKSEVMKASRRNETLEQEIKQLNQIIKDCDQDRQKQKKRLSAIMNERDILGTQLIRRNDELALLYEKIRIQQSTLNKGEAQYHERITDLRMLRIKVNELKRDLHLSQQRIHNIELLKQEVATLQKQLMAERSKVKALSEELENPMNVHRWRKLEGSDPKEYDLIRKIQTLQTRLIAKTEEVVEKDSVIQEKERLYLELKKILSRQPGPEMAEQLNTYHEHLRKRNAQIKQIASELNMTMTQLTEAKYEKERLHRELQESKKRFCEQKMRNQLLERERSLTSSPGRPPGGGSRVSVSAVCEPSARENQAPLVQTKKSSGHSEGSSALTQSPPHLSASTTSTPQHVAGVRDTKPRIGGSSSSTGSYPLQPPTQHQTRFVGGGFALS